jgi:transcriptional regulator with XRE-family HTH domain
MKIALHRKRREMTQAQLAEKCGTTQQQIAKIEGGQVDARVSTLFKIAAALGVDAADLLHTRREFLDTVNGTIQSRGLDMSRMKLARLVSLCSDSTDLPVFHPYWEEIVIDDGRVKFKEI